MGPAALVSAFPRIDGELRGKAMPSSNSRALIAEGGAPHLALFLAGRTCGQGSRGSPWRALRRTRSGSIAKKKRSDAKAVLANRSTLGRKQSAAKERYDGGCRHGT